MESEVLNKIFRFRKFPVYIDGRKFVKELKEFIKKKFPKEEKFELRSQLWRALDSFLLNVAEGADRGSDRDFAKFLNQSHTSLNEVVACLDIALDNGYISLVEHHDWLSRSAELASQLTAFRKTLLSDSKDVIQKSAVNGQRSEVNKGFTLIEIIIYIAIIGVVISGFVSYSLSISGVRNKNYSIATVQANGRAALQVMTQKIREAQAVLTPGAGTSDTQLILDMSGTDPDITFSVSDGVLSMQEAGSSATTITDSRAVVSNLVFTNLAASGERDNVRLEMTVDYNTPTGDVQFGYSKSYQTAASTRP